MRAPTVPSEAASLSILTLNIGAAAPTRARTILRWLRRRREDVLVLTETSAGAGSALIAKRLEEAGYTVVWTQPEGDRGAMLATRLHVRERFCDDLEVTLPWRIAGVRLAADPAVAIVGIYVPSRERSERNVAKKRSFIRSLLEGLQQVPPAIRGGLVLGGDYNAVSRRHVPAHPGFIDCEYELHEELERLGFIAAHELALLRRHPYSWVGRTGHGYLYDYFHLGPALHDRLRRCRYLDGTRRSGISDHSAVSIALAWAPA